MFAAARACCCIEHATHCARQVLHIHIRVVAHPAARKHIPTHSSKQGFAMDLRSNITPLVLSQQVLSSQPCSAFADNCVGSVAVVGAAQLHL
jgi:hypothetical protein